MKIKHAKLIKEINSIEELIKEGDMHLNLTVKDVDLRNADIDWDKIKLANTAFLGCEMDKETEKLLRDKGAFIYPNFVGYPYKPYRRKLYTWQELMEGYEPDNDQSVDFKISTHYHNLKNKEDINEAFAQRIHDNSIDNALHNLLGLDEEGMTEKKCVGIMGGHGVPRNDKFYEKVAFIAKKLTEKGYFILSGGGPGVMEAANLGAYFGGKSEEDLKDAIEILKKAPKIEEKEYVEKAMEVLKKYPEGSENLAIPTWYFGHEPSNVFASHIAKYFANSIREDVLLGSSLYGLIYAPGSAGTLQEVFADICQNTYKTHGCINPMVFFGTKFWKEESGVYDFIQKFAHLKGYGEMLTTSDDIDEIVKFIEDHPPKL